MERRGKPTIRVERTGAIESGASLPVEAGFRDVALYQGCRIYLGQDGQGWWAYIAEFEMETMFCPDKESALAAGQLMVDGMLRSEQASQPRH